MLDTSFYKEFVNVLCDVTLSERPEYDGITRRDTERVKRSQVA